MKSLIRMLVVLMAASTSVGIVHAMNKAELIDAIANDAGTGSGLSKADAKRALEGFINTVAHALKKGDRVSLVGFGSFSISKRAARTGRNPQTGKEIKIAAKNVVKFKAGADLSNKVYRGRRNLRRGGRRMEEEEEKEEKKIDPALIDPYPLPRPIPYPHPERSFPHHGNITREFYEFYNGFGGGIRRLEQTEELAPEIYPRWGLLDALYHRGRSQGKIVAWDSIGETGISSSVINAIVQETRLVPFKVRQFLQSMSFVINQELFHESFVDIEGFGKFSGYELTRDPTWPPAPAPSEDDTDPPIFRRHRRLTSEKDAAASPEAPIFIGPPEYEPIPIVQPKIPTETIALFDPHLEFGSGIVLGIHEEILSSMLLHVRHLIAVVDTVKNATKHCNGPIGLADRKECSEDGMAHFGELMVTAKELSTLADEEFGDEILTRKTQELQSLISGLEGDIKEFEKAGKPTGKRVRKGMQELKTLAQDVRKEVHDMGDSYKMK